MPARYWVIDQSAADELGNHDGQPYDEIERLLQQILDEDEEALDNIIVIKGLLLRKVVRRVISFDDSNEPA